MLHWDTPPPPVRASRRLPVFLVDSLMSLPSAAAGLRGHEDLLGAFQLREDVARYCAPTLNDSTALFEFVQEPEQLARRNVDMGSLPENSKKRETKRSAQGNDRYADHEDTRLLPVLQRDPGRPLLNDTVYEQAT
ncbi:MAG: hypothetical protein MHM6MM_002573 [Cercozoa sp. M6MM]